MPRSARIWEPGDILSIVGRAHEGRPIFAAEDDRLFFLDRLRRVFVAAVVDLLAWALLVNHFHLVIRVTDVPPGTLFLRLNTPIARRERRRRGDHGAVFQDRYWSSPCTDGIVHLLTYVLGNPAHHRVVPTAEALESYRWTAYPEVLGLARVGLVDAEKTLALVHPDSGVARTQLRAAMASRVAGWHAQRDGVDVCEEPGCRGKSDECRLVHPETGRTSADGARISSVAPPRKSPSVSGVHDECMDRAARLRAAGWNPADLIAPVAARIGADPGGVLRGDRLHAECRARAVVVHVACDGVGVPVIELARLLGVSAAAVSTARHRGRRLLTGLRWSVDEVIDSSIRRR